VNLYGSRARGEFAPDSNQQLVSAL
jgi:hypothetical protein